MWRSGKRQPVRAPTPTTDLEVNPEDFDVGHRKSSPTSYEGSRIHQNQARAALVAYVPGLKRSLGPSFASSMLAARTPWNLTACTCTVEIFLNDYSALSHLKLDEATRPAEACFAYWDYSVAGQFNLGLDMTSMFVEGSDRQNKNIVN